MPRCYPPTGINMGLMHITTMNVYTAGGADSSERQAPASRGDDVADTDYANAADSLADANEADSTTSVAAKGDG